MVSPAAGEVVLVPFPYSDLTQSKLRPAVCLAAAGGSDWILCQITSVPYSDPLAIRLDAADFLSGSLQRLSFARPGKLFTADRRIIVRSVGLLQPSTFAAITSAIVAILIPPMTFGWNAAGS